MKIGMLSQWYDPEPGPASLPGVYARALRDRGHTLRVLTGYPNYPTGKLYPGYHQRLRTVEGSGRLVVHRVPLYPSHDGSALRRTANYLSFAGSASLLSGRPFWDVDVMWVYNSPITVTAPTLLHSKRESAPFLLHIQDLWPESVLDSGMLPPTGILAAWTARGIRAVVRLAERRAGAIAIISPSVRQILMNRGVPEEKIVYVNNPTDEALFYPRELDPAVAAKYGLADKFTIMYAGSVGDVQDLDTAIDAMNSLRHLKDVELVIVGSGIAERRLRKKASELDLTSVRFVGRVHAAEIPALLAASDVQLVSLKDRPFLRATIPSKIPAILASGRPLLGALRGDGARLIEAAGAGPVVRPESPQELAGAIEHLRGLGPDRLVAMGVAASHFYRERMSMGVAGPRMDGVLAKLASGGAA